MKTPIRKGGSRAASGLESRFSLAIGLVALAIAAGLPQIAGADPSGKIGLIGDSMMVGTNTDHMCGAGKEIPDCIDSKFGQHDLAWSHGGGEHAWSIARRLGYSPRHVINEADDGEEWKDALDQAMRITADPDVDAIFINMGANDICEKSGHDYTGDLAEIEQHIDDTLSHLVEYLSFTPEAKIYWSGIPDIVQFRDVMVNRRHNYMFRSCQGLWDLDSDEVTEEAAQSICKDEGFPGDVCDSLADWAWARDRIIDELLDYYLDKYDVNEGPCGRVLDSGNSQAERDEARQFNEALNALFARKAAEYNGSNGVEIIFTNVLYDLPIESNYVSRLDCYHPNRTGQMKLAQELWKEFDPIQENNFTFWFDEFNDHDWCTQEFASPWASCWYDYGDPGFDIRVDGSGWLRVQKDTNRNRQRQVVREVGDLSDMTHAWMSFNHKRENLDDGGDRVYFKVYKDGIWHWVDQFKGSGNDVGEHAGKYYDLTPFLSSDLRIMFQTENQRSMKSGDRVKFDNINIFAWDDVSALAADDLNADRVSDILWRHTATGAAAVWLMDGFTKQAETIAVIGTEWNVEGLGDFDGDRRSDILWRNADTNNVVIWFMDGFTKLSAGSIGAPPADWQVVGPGDFNGEGKSDILWRHRATGNTVIWQMNGLTRKYVGSLGALSTVWQVRGLADFNADTRTDVLWRNSETKDTVIWLMDGFTTLATGDIGAPSLDWQIVGAGDFDGDDHADILWRNATDGTAVIWKMDGVSVIDEGVIGEPSPVWEVVGVGDFNGDGRSDILWRHMSSGSAVIWLMDGFAMLAAGSIGSPDLDWQIQ